MGGEAVLADMRLVDEPALDHVPPKQPLETAEEEQGEEFRQQ